LDLLDKKFEAVCNAVFGIQIIVSDHIKSHDVLVAVVGQAQTSECTPSNPIRLVEDPEDPMDKQNW
jgi:hypothetical protein